MENMVTYPSHLLPREYYRIISDKDWIRFLTVFTWTKDNRDSITGEIHPNSFCHPSKNMDDFSTNLLGVFVPQDNCVEIKGPDKNFFTAYWQENEKVPEPQHQKDFDFNYDRGYFFLDVYEFINEIEVAYKKGGQNYPAWPKVIHTPTRANFWHVSIRWVDSDNQEVRAPKNVPDWKRRLYSEARNLLIEYASFEEPPYNEIPQSVYQKEHF